MNNTFLKSIVSSIQTATTSYFSPKHCSKPSVHQDKSSPGSPTRNPAPRMAPATTAEKQIFGDVVYYDASSSLSNEHRQALQSGGALEYSDDGDVIEWNNITHVFTIDLDFPGKHQAIKHKGLAIMTPRWIEVTARRNVLQDPRSFSPDPRMFFSGLVVTCAELPDGDREAIFGGFAACGGMYDDTLRTTTTHIIALNVDNEKCRRALKQEQLGIKIVLPHWFDDCLKLRRRVDEKPYMLPDPPLFKAFAAQNIGNNPSEPASSDHLAYTHFGSIQNQSTPPACTATIFKGNHKTVFLGKDLGVGTRLRATLEHVVEQAGGKLVDSVSKAQVYVGSWREKEDYIQASRKGRVVGNLTWLYYMLANDRWISPRCHLLHYPLVRGGMTEMKNMVMTVTNYQGEARAYLEKLIEACGAKFTRNMTTVNTHLIAASKTGEKCKHAHDWGISIVNHLWLEESYAKWQVQSVTVPRYTHFPPQTNLTEIIDKTEIQEEGILDFYNPRADDDEDTTEAGLATTGNRRKSKDVQSSYVQNAETKTPAPLSEKEPAAVASIAGPGTPVTEPMKTSTPGSNRRKAAENAMTKLHNEIMPDVLLWEKEKNRKRFPIEPPQVQESEKKRVEKRKNEEKENTVEGATKKAKKDLDNVRDASDLGNKITLLVTGATEDITNATSIKKLSRLGIKLASEGGYCTHLAAPNILRTEKFLCALAYAPTVVSINWIHDCLEQDKALDTQAYLLCDPENEKKYGTVLQDAVAKARENRRQLFKKYQIYISSSVPGHPSLLRIVEANGGEARIVSSTIKGRAKILRSDYLKTVDQILVCMDTSDDKMLREKFKEEAIEGGLTWGMVSSEWIMVSVLRQEIVDDDGIVIS